MHEMHTISAVGTRLRETLQGTLDSIPNPPKRPQEIARRLRLNSNLTSRVCAALRSPDPLETMSLIPGPVPLRQFLSAATAVGADGARVAFAQEAVQCFETIIRDEFDDRAGLDSLLGTHIPEMRRRHELAAKQAVFRGMEALKGISCDTSSVAFVVHPNAHSTDRVDLIMIGAYYGLRRIRPSAKIKFTAELAMTASSGRPVREYLPGSNSDAALLRTFCRPVDVQVTRTDVGDIACYEVGGTAIGRSSAVDIVLSEYYPKRMKAAAALEPGRVRHFDATIEIPSKQFVFDLLIHQDAWPGARFELTTFDTAVTGMVDPNARTEQNSEFNLMNSLSDLGMGVDVLRSSRLPRYVETLDHVMGRLPWKGSEFRTMRCEIAYPVYGSQLCLIHQRPGA